MTTVSRSVVSGERRRAFRLRRRSTVQELLGHRDVTTTMIYTNVLNRGPAAVREPRGPDVPAMTRFRGPGASSGIDGRIACTAWQPIPTRGAWADRAQTGESKGEQSPGLRWCRDRDRLYQFAASPDYADQSIQSSNSS